MCKDTGVFKALPTIRSYRNTTTADDLRTALAFVGPVAVGIDASLRSFTFYSHGVYDDPACDPSDLNHAVLVVGYGSLHQKPYWLIKNSWSTYWGMNGYVLVSQKGDMCGVTTSGTYVEL